MNDVEIVRIKSRHQTIGQVTSGIAGSAMIISVAVPLFALSKIIEPLAGQTTVFEANLALSTIAGVSLALNAGMILKGRSRKEELQRLRERIGSLEARLEIPRQATTRR